MRKNLMIVRMIMGVIVGAGVSILLMSFIRNYILATILGMLVALAISGRSTPSYYALIGFLTGALAGIYLGATPNINWIDITGLNMLAVMLLTGFLCAGYGYLIGKLQQVLKKGYGPFV
jgi:hypothetical protein